MIAVLPLIAMSARTASAQTQTRSEAIWRAYQAAPHEHAHIPHNAYAGYRRGETDIPTVGAVTDVTDHGAKPGDELDDSAAFRAAIDAAWQAGGGAVTVPAGHYHLRDPLWVWASGVVIRGAGQDRTVLEFTRPLVESVGHRNPNSTNIWSWTGGLVWISPRDAVIYARGDGAIGVNIRNSRQDYNSSSNPWEYWREGKVLSAVDQPHDRGSRTLRVADASGIEPGQMILLTYENTRDRALWLHLAADDKFRDWNHWGQWFQPEAFPRWQWPVQVDAVEGDTLTLAQPLRVAIKPAFKVQVRRVGPYIEEAGVEHLTIRLNAGARGAYDNGWNGLFLNRAYNCWVRHVGVVNGNNGFHVSASKNVSLLNTRVSGDTYYHHPYTNRCMSHDVLYRDFEVSITEDSRGGTHGLNSEFLSSGNVWSRGRMNRGTFDTHRGMPFDLIRTEITLSNESKSNPGGAKKAGPYALRRMVHWNVQVTGSDRPESERGLYVNQPQNHTYGALVGIRGAPISNAPAWNNQAGGVMPLGDKHVLIADTNRVPEPANLHDAQVRLRAESETWVRLAEPHLSFVPAGRPITLRAAVNAGQNRAEQVTFEIDGEPIATISDAPYTTPWRPKPGQYELGVVMKDSAGRTVGMPEPRRITVGSVQALEEDHPDLKWHGPWDRGPLKGDEWYGQAAAFTHGNDDAVEFTFTGTRFVFISSGQLGHKGEFDVLINGRKVAERVNIRGKGGSRHIAYDTGWMPPEQYTVRIDNRNRLVVDRILIYRTER